jgi:glycosyltransferase involved in cell wall biosynthesis
MRIMLMSWEFPPYLVGGISSHVAGLAPALGGMSSHHGPCHIDIVTTRLAGGRPLEVVNDFVSVHRVEVARYDPDAVYDTVIAANVMLAAYASRLAEQTPYDLVHVHDWLPAAAAMHIKEAHGLPLVATIHATERGRQQGFLTSANSSQIDALETRLCAQADRIIVCSQFMSSEVTGYFGAPASHITVVPNGIEPRDLYYCSPEQRATLRAYHAPNGEHLLLYVGRIVYEKGLHVLLEAMPAVLEEFPETRLLVAGRDGRQLQPRAIELGVDHAVRFLDFITDQQRDSLYQIVDAAVFPSLYEPFGIVALEAMALNCNVIASDVGGLGEIVQHQVNGLTVLPKDPASIAWAVRELFRDPHAAAQRRAVGLRQVQELFSWHAVARATAAVFDAVLEGALSPDAASQA